MAEQNETEKIIRILRNSDAILLGNLSKVYQRRLHKGKSKPYWYLTWKEGEEEPCCLYPASRCGASEERD